MNNRQSHQFIATASTAAVSLTMLVAAGAFAQDTSPTATVTQVASADAAPSASATQLQARIIDVSGKARWRSSPDGEWKDAAVNDDLSPGAEVRTGMRSRVTLRFRNATVLVDSSTNFSVPTIEQEGDVLRTIAAVRSGRADFKVDKVGLQNDFKVVTPSTTLAVRGTSFSTVTGPLKGVEIVGARENAIRAIEVRYAALNQPVEMSGGSEARSTSETPNPTEHAFGTTFNVPQPGQIASKEEAQQGAFAGSSAPQTQRQSTTTVAGVNQVRQDLAAAERGESGNGNLSVLIDIARAAGFRAITQDASAEQAAPLAEVLARAVEARELFGELSGAADEYDARREAAQQAIAAAQVALAAADAAAGVAGSSEQSVVSAGQDAFRSFVLQQSDATVRGHVEGARTAADAGSASAAELPGHLVLAQQSIGEASGDAASLAGLADLFAAARASLDAANAAIENPNAQVQTLRDLAVEANDAVQAIAAGRSVPQLQQAALEAAQAAAEAVQRAVEAGAARDEVAANAAIALVRAQSIVRDALAQEIESTSAAVAGVQSRLAEVTEAAAQAQSHVELLDAAIDGMLVARSGAEEAAAAADAASAFQGLAEGRRVAAQAQADFAAGIGALVSSDRLTALTEMQSALAALERCELNAAATSAFAAQVSEALGEEIPDLNAAGTAAAQALAQAVLAEHEASEATGASERADGAALSAASAVASTEFGGSETLYGELVQLASQDASDASGARDAAADAAEASGQGASLATSLSTQIESVFGSDGDAGTSDAGAALAAAQQLASDAAARAADAQSAYLAAQAAYEGALAAGRSSAEVTVWGAVRALAAQARTDADTALAAAAEARRVASIAMAEALAADAAVNGAGFPALAQMSLEAAASAKASALSGMGDVLSLVQAHQQVLDGSSEAVAQALATLGSTLAATEVAQSSSSGVADRLSGARDAIFAFIAADEAGDVPDSQVDGLLSGLLAARNEALGLALAAGASAADAGAAVAAHAQSIAAGDAAGAQAQADAVQAILVEAAAALGTDVNDPRLAVMRSLRDRALERADAASASAGDAIAIAGGAGDAQSAAREALAALGLYPAWGIGDVAGTFGADVESAAGSAAAAAASASEASRGASILVALYGAAQGADASVGASEEGTLAAREAESLAAGAASVARSAVEQIAGGDNSARAQALASIAQASGQVTALEAQSNSSISLAGGRLDALLEQLSSGTLDVSEAMSALATAQSAASAARENADAASTVAAAAGSVSAEFQQLVVSLGVGGAQAIEVIQQIDAVQLAAAESFRQMADDQRQQVNAFVDAVLAAAAAGEDVTMSDLAFAASWIRQVTLEDYQVLQASIAAAEAARSDALDAVGEFEQASAGATAPVMEAAQDALDAADAFLRQVVALQVEVAIGGRAVDGEVARSAASAVESQVVARASEVSATVNAMRTAIDDYGAAATAMSAAVSAAQSARSDAESRLMQLEQSLASADARLASLRTSLESDQRTSAGEDASVIASDATVAQSSAQLADAARANALSALAGIDSLGTSAAGALVRLEGAESDAAVHQVALSWQQEQAEDARNAAIVASEGVEALVTEAGTERAAALGAHALAASGDALNRASAALAGILSAGGSLESALSDAGGVNRDAAGVSEGQASALREWAASLDYGTSSIPTLIADRVVAMSGVAEGAIGAYDARVAAVTGREASEQARDRALAATYVTIGALESHQAAMVGVNEEHDTALGQTFVAFGELVVATAFRADAAYWLDQTLNYVEASDASAAAWAAGSADQGATGAEDAAGRAGYAASLAEAAGDRALQWAELSASAFAIAQSAASDAETERDAAVALTGEVIAAGDAAGSFAAAAEQFAAIAATAAAGDASAFAQQARDQAVAQIVLAEAARDAAQTAAANARTHANKIVFGAVAAKAEQTVALAVQARDYADGALAQAQAARADANTAIQAASSAAGGTQ